DGIRVFHVTGVQTCALPIYKSPLAQTDASRRRERSAFPCASVSYGRAPLVPETDNDEWCAACCRVCPRFGAAPKQPKRHRRSSRSEERRVGQEHTAQGAPSK